MRDIFAWFRVIISTDISYLKINMTRDKWLFILSYTFLS